MKLAKDSPVRSKAYLDHVRSQRCVWCSHPPPSEASHHPRAGGGSVSMKACDLRALPLCTACHRSFHRGGSLGSMSGEQTREWAEQAIVDTLRAYVREVLT